MAARYMSTEEEEAQHLRMQVQYEKAKALVSSWLGDSDSDSEPEALPRQLNGTSGLGATSVKAATSIALEKLKKQQKKSEVKGGRAPAKAAAPAAPSGDSDSDEVSRASLSKRSAGKSAFDMHKKKQKKK